MTQFYIDSDIRRIRELHSSTLSINYADTSILDRLAQQADAILSAHQQGNNAVTFHLGCWSSEFIGKSKDEIMRSNLTLEQCQDTIAKEHGFQNWIAVQALQDSRLDPEFEACVDAVTRGNLVELEQRLSSRSELISQQSQYGHRATLLHYIGANGVESYRQITPLNAAEVAAFLIEAGADVNAAAMMYGGGATTLNLVLSSAHPRNAGITSAIARVLEAAGAV